MAPPSTPYDRLTPLLPSANLTDFTLLIDLSTRMSAAWWASAENTNARRGRAFKDDGVTELPCDWIAYDHAAQTGWLRVKYTGTLATSGTQQIRIYPPKVVNSVQLSNDPDGGKDFAYDSDWREYLPLVADFSNRIPGGLEYIADADATPPVIGTLAAREALLLDGTNNLVSTTNSAAYLHSTAMGLIYEASSAGNGALVGMSYNSIRLRQGAYDHDAADRSAVSRNATAAPYVTGAWSHIAASNGETDAYYYVEGVDVTQGVTDPLPWVASQSLKLTIGARAEGHSFHVTGGVAEIQLHQVQRSAAWVEQERDQVTGQSTFWSAPEHFTGDTPSGGSSTPVNLNLDRIVLPTREATELTKVLVVHDSQGLRQSNRWVGQTSKWDMQHVGMMCYSVNQSGVGPYFLAETTVPGATITHTRMNPGDNWGDGNTSDHAMWGSKIAITGTIDPNFQPLVRFGINNAGFVNAYPVDNRHHARVITRDISGNFARYRLTEFRGTTEGTSDDFGDGAFDPVNFDFDGSLKIANWGTRDAGAIGSSGEIVGTIVKDSNASDTNRELHVLGALIYSSPSAENFESTGLVLANTGYSGWSCYDHINRQSLQTKEAMVEVAEGYDTVIIMMGHNAEDLGDFDANLTSLISLWKSAHTNKGYAEPDFLLIAPWAAAGTDMTVEKKNLTRAVALAGGYGFISLWDSYGEVNPDGRTERLDGTTVTAYSMDLTHPSDATTAEHIAKDIEWHFDPANHYIGGGSVRHPIRSIGGFRRFGVIATPPSSPAQVEL